MKSSGAPKTGKTTSKKLPMVTYLWGGICALAILMLLILFFVSQGGHSDSNPLLLIYNRSAEEMYIANPSLANSLHVAGYEFKVIGDEANEIPESIAGRNVTVMGIGEESFALMRDINENELGTANKGKNNILGYVLIDPKYPGNLSVEKYDSKSPDCFVAIFGFGKTCNDPQKMGDSRRLFERMSGVDSVYGTFVKRGVIFGSNIYFSADQKRYLSLYDKVNYNQLINSSTFQNELAGYLGSVAGNKVNYSKINSWFVLETLGVVVALVALFLTLFFIPVPERKGISFDKVGDDGIAGIVNVGLGIWFGVLIVAGYVIPYTREYVKYIINFAPLFMLFVMFIMRIGFILTNKIRYKRDGRGILRTLSSGALVTALFVVCWLTVRSGNLSTGKRQLVMAAGIFVMDVIIVTCLGYADKKSRAGGQNGCSYFGNFLYPALMLIPSATAIVISFLGMGSFLAAFRGLLIVLIPFLLSYPVKRTSENVLFAGIVHAIAYSLLIL